MKKSITKNYIYNLTYEILALILPLITTPYISRILGAENIGIYSYTTSITTYFILFGSLGIAKYGQMEIAYLQGKSDKYSKTFWEIVVLRFVTMAVSMLIFYITFVNGAQYQIYYRILLLELLANCLDISWFFQGLEEFKKIVIRNILVKVASVVAIFALVKTSDDLYIYFLIYALSTLLGNISMWTYLPKYLKKTDLRRLNILRHIKPTIGLFIPQIAIQIYTVLDKVMIGTIIPDKSEVGYYEQSQKIIKILLTVVTSLGTVMIPRMANTFINGEKEKLEAYMKRSFAFVFLLAFPVIFGIISVAKNFVPIFYGPNYDKVAILMSVISPVVLVIGLSNVIGTQYLLPTKKQKEFTISVIAGAAVNFIINMLLIWNFASIGASIGTIIAETCVTALQFYFIRKDFNIKDIFKLAKNYVISALIMFAICMIVGQLITDRSQCLITQVVVGVITYGTCLIILKDELVCTVLDRIRYKLMKQ